MPERVYDAAKAHDYYIRTRKLKGRQKGAERESGSTRPGAPKPQTKKKGSKQEIASADAKVAAIRGKLDRLRELLKQKQAASKPSQAAPKNHQQKEKDQQQSEDYYEKHKQKIKAERGKGSGGSSKKTAADVGIDELKTTIRNTVVQLKKAIAEARQTRGG